ncbi:MAG: YqgE/AlgH family protein [Burkholderiales bacterium]|nr:YqgE/AlgH family protein [Burkholderiales bacterium]
MVRLVVALAFAFAFALASPAAAQERGFLIVAKPHVADPNFRRAVLLVTQAPDGAALGVIINRPANKSLAEAVPEEPKLARFTEPLYVGGPVERVGLFAVFRAPAAPGEAFRAGEDLWIALAPPTVQALLDAPPESLRLYVGYAGWAPGQLRGEVDRGDWWVLDADPDIVFRKDTKDLWDELAKRAQSATTRRNLPIPAMALARAMH